MTTPTRSATLTDQNLDVPPAVGYRIILSRLVPADFQRLLTQKSLKCHHTRAGMSGISLALQAPALGLAEMRSWIA
jgi:hypothetical protein